MKQLLLVIAALVTISVAAQAQYDSNQVRKVNSLPATCTVGTTNLVVYQGTTYQCTATNTWTKTAGLLPTSTYAGLPTCAAGNDGQMVRVTDANRDVYSCYGTSGKWVSRNGGGYNIRDFGAVGDGSTADTTAINLAVSTAATAGGGKVIVPDGDFAISDAINVNSKSNITIEGSGYASRIKAPSAGWDLTRGTAYFGIINVKGSDKIRITNLRVYGTKVAADSNHTPKLIYFETVDGLTIDHCWLDNSYYEGIWQGGTQANNKKVIIESNHLYDIGVTGGLPAIQLNVNYGVIANNELDTVGTGIGGSGVRLVITGNSVKGSTTTGISVGDGGDNGAVVSGNTVTFTEQAAASYGFLADGGNVTNYQVSFTGNTCNLTGTGSGTSAVCYYVTTVSNASFSSNIADISVRGSGFQFGGTSTGLNVDATGNTVKVRSASGTSYGFVASPSTGDSVTARLANNRVYGITRANNSYGYFFSTVSGGTLSYSMAGDLTEEGYVRFSSSNLISDGSYDNRAIYTSIALVSVPVTATSGGTTTLDLALGDIREVTFPAGNTTLAFSHIPVGNVTIILIQDSTGSRTVTWPASVKWAGGTSPTLSTAANAVDVFAFACNGSVCRLKSATFDVK